jgi:hypothetical protein
MLIGISTLLCIGSPVGQRLRRFTGGAGMLTVARVLWTSAIAPWRLVRQRVDLAPACTVTFVALLVVAMLSATLTGFTSVSVMTVPSLLLAIVALAFASTAKGEAAGQQRGRLLVACIGPLIPGLLLLLGVVAYAGPVGFWYWFWVQPVFRAACMAVLMATFLWTAYIMLAATPAGSWYARPGGLLTAAGAGLLALTTVLPGWVDVLRSLDRPLNVAPATQTMIFALRTYVDVSLDFGRSSWFLGAVLLVAGYAITLKSTAPQASDDGGNGR